jgi:hypothetical protein
MWCLAEDSAAQLTLQANLSDDLVARQNRKTEGRPPAAFAVLG